MNNAMTFRVRVGSSVPRWFTIALLLCTGCGSSDENAEATNSEATSGASAPGGDGSASANGDGMGLAGAGAGGENGGNGNDGPETTPSGVDVPGNDGSGGSGPVEMPSGGAPNEPVNPPASGGAAGLGVDPGTGGDGGAENVMPVEPGSGGAEPAPIVPVSETSGCAANASPPVGAQTIDVDGTERSYIVSLPEGYDPETPYPLVFAFHGLGGSAELVSGRFYFGLEVPEGKPTIFVYPDGLETDMGGAGWPNTDGQDVAFFDVLLAHVENNYCVDGSRVFSTGHSFGGMMTHTLACERAEVLRAIAPVAGAYFGFGNGGCSGPVAAWGAHGNPDNTVAYDSGLSAIERVMETNGCDAESGTAVEPTEFCTLYDCDPGYPVTWCVHDQDHDWPEFAAESIRAFFDSF